MKKKKTPEEIMEEEVDLAEVAGDLEHEAPAAAPQVVAMRLLKFAQTNLREMIGDAPERQFEHTSIYTSRLRQLAGKLTLAIDLLEGRQTLTDQTEVPE